MVKKVVYKVITGNRFKLGHVEHTNESWDHVCFTNRKEFQSSSQWQIINIPESDLDDKRLSKRIKMLTGEYLPDYDLSIYLDGPMKIRCDLDGLVEEYLGADDDIAMMRHYGRTCIYSEAKACKSLRKDDPEVIDAQMERYRKEEFPTNLGLPAGGVIIKRKNERTNSFMKQWFEEIQNGSCRDQLSFMYVMWKNNFPLKLNYMPWDTIYPLFK